MIQRADLLLGMLMCLIVVAMSACSLMATPTSLPYELHYVITCATPGES
jgi:hypothetical protein